MTSAATKEKVAMVEQQKDEKRAKDLNKKNQLCRSMNKGQRAVAIAKDVLAQLHAKRIVAKQGIYIGPGRLGKYDDCDEVPEVPLEEIAERKCKCCAVGAAMLSFSRLFNRILVNPWDIDPDRDTLSEAFSWRTIALMEVAFEHCLEAHSEAQCDRGEDIRISENDLEAARGFGKHASQETLLQSIMQNVIENDGEFKPIGG